MELYRWEKTRDNRHSGENVEREQDPEVVKVTFPEKAHSSHFWQVSWLSFQRTGRLPDRCAFALYRSDAHAVSGILASPPRSQWRGRAGFSPASLL